MSNRRKLKRLVGRQPWEPVGRGSKCDECGKPLRLEIIHAEREQVMWARIPGYGLRFWFRSAEQEERLQSAIAEIGQVLDDNHN